MLGMPHLSSHRLVLVQKHGSPKNLRRVLCCLPKKKSRKCGGRFVRQTIGEASAAVTASREKGAYTTLVTAEGKKGAHFLWRAVVWDGASAFPPSAFLPSASLASHSSFLPSAPSASLDSHFSFLPSAQSASLACLLSASGRLLASRPRPAVRWLPVPVRPSAGFPSASASLASRLLLRLQVSIPSKASILISLTSKSRSDPLAS